MEIKILQVFLGADGLPYKDQERTVHFPIVGSGFQGASNTTKIRFYYDELVEQDDTETAWVACAKLPNGKIGSKVLETDYDSTLDEHYALLELDSFYFQYKGDVYISLQGYQGGVQVSYDEETELYTINGTPTIAATGSIKLSVNYATQFVGSGETSNVNFQRILADLGTKLGIRAQSEHVEELPTVGQNDIFYVINDDPNNPNLQNIYVWNENTQSYIWVGDNTLDLGEYYTKAQGEQFENGIDNRLTNVENELSNVASGSPKGVYDTLAALQTAYPTGATGIYVVNADGHWYYWNGSAWTDGGVYLATPIEDNSITAYKLKDELFELNKASLINPANILYDATLSKATIPSGYSSYVTLLHDYPSKTIHIESVDNNFKGVRVYAGHIFNPMTSITIKIRCKMRVKRNAAHAYQTPAFAVYYYLDNALKGAFSIPNSMATSDSWSNWIELETTKTFAATDASFNYFEFGASNKFDYEFKDIYIVETANDNDYGYSIYDYIKNKLMNPLGKVKLSIIGDSISDTDYEPYHKWCYFLKEYDNYELDNVSVSGAGYFNPSNKGGTYDHQFYNQANLIAVDSDIVIVFGGFNDLSKIVNGDVTIGSRDDTGVTTFCGCVNTTINNILTRNPNCHLVISLPTPWQGMNSMIDQSSTYYDALWGVINSLKEICEYRSIPLLDMFHNSGIRPWISAFRSEYMVDGTHPNEKGHLQFLYPKFREFLNKENWKKSFN